ncbi:MAG: hypothetical protein WAV25_03020 [Minisyncoccia bacterium]
MDTLLQSQIFFFISSVGFVLLWILLAVFLYYLIRTTRTLSRIMEKVERDIETIGDTTKELIEEMQDSTVFRFLFGSKRKRRKSK